MFLIVCLGFRAGHWHSPLSIWFSQGLDAAMRMESAFGTWFLVPLLMAVGILLFEAGRVAGIRRLTTIACSVPVLCLGLSIPWSASSLPAIEFLSEFTREIGSPLWGTVVASLLFYVYACWRRTLWAEQLLLATLLVATVVGRETHGLDSLQPLQLWPLAIITIWQGFVGLDRRDSRATLLAVVCLLMSVRSLVPSDISWIYRSLLPLHAAGGACLVLAAVFHDPLCSIPEKARCAPARYRHARGGHLTG